MFISVRVCANSAPPACCKNVLLLDSHLAFSKKKIIIENNNRIHLRGQYNILIYVYTV